MPPPILFHTTTATLLTLFLISLPIHTFSTTLNNHHRRLLHHPFIPLNQTNTHPKHTFSDSSTPPTTTNYPFFPTFSTPPPPSQPPPSTTTALPTFPANISSLALPTTSSHSSHSHPSSKLLTTLILLSLLTLFLFLSLFFLLHHHRRRRRHHHHTPSSPSSPPTPPPPKLPTSSLSHTSSEFLYLGTITNNHNHIQQQPPSPPEVYLKLCDSGSPELNPLPPLPKFTSQHNSHVQFQPTGDHEDEFFSPTASSSEIMEEVVSPASSPSRDSEMSMEIQELAAAKPMFQAPPPPPPPPPASARGGGPPELRPPSGEVVFRRSGSGGGGERKEEMKMTKLKALHWDKVRASSDRVMVWDHLKPGSFQLNEEMIETLFKANGAKDGARRSIMPLMNEETRVLDPKKSQNVAILLKALNVTVEEVCEALQEGNADTLGTELLESLLKMAPTKEEEMKIKQYKDESPLKLGPAEKFLKAVLDVPFAFKRVDAMLYIATFDSEVEYLRKSFETLEVACEELRNSRMFLKLLEAVLKTGNRMNVGTNRGDAQAFKLDTLLKLVDIKGTDGKTTLLHFVVQEIIKAEGARLSRPNDDPTTSKLPNQPSTQTDIDLKKKALDVVAGLGGELTNIKKAAAMDSDALSSDVIKLARGIVKVQEVVEMGRRENNLRFSESMKGFLTKGEEEIIQIQSQESNAFSRVKELTEYFHGNLAKEEAHPLRIFMVVRDFLGVLDRVCKEVGKINDRTVISATRSLPVTVNSATYHPPFPAFSGTQRESSSDDENIVLT